MQLNGVRMGTEIRDTNIEEQLAETGKIVWRCRGVSMKPLLRPDKDLVVIESAGRMLKKYDVALYRNTRRRDDLAHREDGLQPESGSDRETDARRDDANRVYVLHRVIDVEGEQYIILGDNCVSLEYIPRDDIIGKMTARIRDGKEQKLEGPGHSLYMNLWIKPWRFRVGLIKGRNKARRFASGFLPTPVKKAIKKVLHKGQ